MIKVAMFGALALAGCFAGSAVLAVMLGALAGLVWRVFCVVGGACG